MRNAQVAFTESVRTRVLHRDPSVLEEIDEILRHLGMTDEPRQHVICWLDRVMQNPHRASRLPAVDDFSRFFLALGKRHEQSRERREMLRALRDAAFARERTATASRRGLNGVEQAELVSLVRERVSRHCDFDAEVFVNVVFRGASYAAIAAELESRFGRVDPAQLRGCVAKVRADLRSSFAWYLRLGPSDFPADSRGSAL